MLYIYTTDMTCLLGTMITFTPTHVYTHCLSHYILGILSVEMLIVVEDYTWSEMIYEVVIIVPLKGANPSKAEVMIMIM